MRNRIIEALQSLWVKNEDADRMGESGLHARLFHFFII